MRTYVLGLRRHCRNYLDRHCLNEDLCLGTAKLSGSIRASKNVLANFDALQPPVELLRQWMDHEGWYDRADNSWRSIVDVLFCVAMGPPGGGRNPVTARFVRHFHLIAISEFDDSTYSSIYMVQSFLPIGEMQKLALIAFSC